MSKQAHDQGQKKRQPRDEAEAPKSTEVLARELVTRGLASNLILDPRSMGGRRDRA